MSAKRSFFICLLIILVCSFTETTVAGNYLHPRDKYLKLKTNERKKYMRSIRQAYTQFEKSISKNKKYSIFNFQLFEQAYAGWEEKCVIGGIIRDTIGGKCSTRDRGCPEEKPDGFRCGLIFGENVCIDRVDITTISDRCEAAAKDIPAEEYQKYKAEFEALVDVVCAKTDETIKNPCDVVKNRIAKINTEVTPPPEPEPEPTPPPTPVPPTPDDTSFNVPDADKCQKNRDQGQNGTCHAFCLTCVMDQEISQKTQSSSKVSANWIAMLSIVNKICDDSTSVDTLSDNLLQKGWYPNQNMILISAYGVCQQNEFTPYSPEEGKDWAASFIKRVNTRGALAAPTLDDTTMVRQFGINQKNAYDLFCPSEGKTIIDDIDRQRYAAKLETLKAANSISDKFYRCAKSSLSTAKELGWSEKPTPSCDIMHMLSNNNDINIIKNFLKSENRPIPIVIETDVENHGYHCITLTGWDDEKKVFKTVNSWGENTRFDSIPYDKASTIKTVYPSDCMFNKSEPPATPKPQSTPKAVPGTGRA